MAEEIGEIEFIFRVLVYGGQPILIRMSGVVVMPKLEIFPQILNFAGVFLGSHSELNMMLKNTASVKMQVTFDLNKYGDFSIKEVEETQDMSTHLAHFVEHGAKTITLAPMQAKEVATTFRPTEVAWYDFKLPMSVNGIRVIDEKVPTVINTNEVGKTVGNPHLNRMPSIAGSSQCVLQATALRAPIVLQPSDGTLKVNATLGASGEVLSERDQLTGVNIVMVYHEYVFFSVLVTFKLQSATSDVVEWSLDCTKLSIKPASRRPNIQIRVADSSIFVKEETAEKNRIFRGKFQEKEEFATFQVTLVPGIPPDKLAFSSTALAELAAMDVEVPVTLIGEDIDVPMTVTSFWPKLSMTFDQASLPRTRKAVLSEAITTAGLGPIDCPFTVAYPDGQGM
ncbi:unnamed protein product [Dibothriocephalus latus]|uniref:Uncharacterized protein n=1 Tax=Dibothriocephalus latus TaxID=60516 RepID=A0A3P7NTI5_DIBLA|nr:unnamed protein product [Dibothriocephalus latus]